MPERKFSILNGVLQSNRLSTVALQLWDGTIVPALCEEKARIIVSTPEVLNTLLFFPTPLSLGEAFISGGLDIIGDFEEVLQNAEFLLDRPRPRLARWLRYFVAGAGKNNHSNNRRIDLTGERYSRGRTKKAISYHYDLPVEFWREWLDESLAYSCAYFQKGDEDIDTAQEKKYDYVCRKLYLQKGETLLDLGCGWGGLVIHAARYFGAKSTGITLSSLQAKYATDKIQRLGLNDSCTILQMDIRDYRAVQPFDKVASVGAVEHFGDGSLEEFFLTAWKNLKSQGLFLCHGITSTQVESGRGKSSFTDKYLFPDYQLSPVHLLLQYAERAGFEIRDVESLREHYVMTFERWWRRLEQKKETIIRSVGEMSYRIFLLSLHYMHHKHRLGHNSLHQLLLAKPLGGLVNIPLTRHEWYKT